MLGAAAGSGDRRIGGGGIGAYKLLLKKTREREGGKEGMMEGERR